MRSSIFLGLAIALCVGAPLIPADASAQTARAARAQAEGSMVLTGNIDIAPDGRVETLSLRNEAKIDPSIRAFIDRTVSQWRFEPVLRDGKAVAARTPVNLRLLAKQTPGGQVDVVLKNASFVAYDSDATDEVVSVGLRPPAFPDELLKQRGAGDVVLLVKVDRDGTIADVVAEQVNLHKVGPARVMERMRAVMDKNAVSAARKWTFRVPTTGDQVDAPFWTVRVPVSFTYIHPNERYGTWQAYVPGPKQKAPWAIDDAGDDSAADALPESGVYMVGVDKGPKLLTPLQG